MYTTPTCPHGQPVRDESDETKSAIETLIPRLDPGPLG
jgi:hypothetical protein